MSKVFSISSCFEPIDVITFRTPWWPQLHSTNHQLQVSSIYYTRFLWQCHKHKRIFLKLNTHLVVEVCIQQGICTASRPLQVLFLFTARIGQQMVHLFTCLVLTKEVYDASKFYLVNGQVKRTLVWPFGRCRRRPQCSARCQPWQRVLRRLRKRLTAGPPSSAARTGPPASASPSWSRVWRFRVCKLVLTAPWKWEPLSI